jgi:hypothetical protein
MPSIVPAPQARRLQGALSLVDAERLRVRRLPSIRMLVRRHAMPIETALAVAEACGMYVGGER